MLTNIQLKLRKSTASWNQSFDADFISLLSSCHNARKVDDKTLTLGSRGLLPTTEIFFDEEAVSVSFEDSEKTQELYQAGGLRFGLNLPKIKSQSTEDKKFVIKKDQAGEYCVIKRGKDTYYQLTLAQLLSRFKGKCKEVNHTGINFSSVDIPEKEYLAFRQMIAESCYLVRYPKGEEWPFILPCTKTENKKGIKDTKVNRNPKFEFVFSDYNKVPVMQFDLETTLTREEVFALLPDPYGVSFDGLEDKFRTVFINTDYKDIFLRFDIGFAHSRPGDFYAWMIAEGGRIV